MSGDVNAYYFFLEIQFFNLTERLYLFDLRLRHNGTAAAAKQTCLRALLLLRCPSSILDRFLQQTDVAIFRIHVLAAMNPGETIECSRQRETFKRLLVD